MDELTATRIAAHLQKEVKQLASASKVAGDKVRCCRSAVKQATRNKCVPS